MLKAIKKKKKETDNFNFKFYFDTQDGHEMSEFFEITLTFPSLLFSNGILHNR